MKIQALDNLTDQKAVRREQKKRPRMRQHGRSLKKSTPRSVQHIHKLAKK